MELRICLLYFLIFATSKSAASPRLIGGELAVHGQFPFVAYLLHAADGDLQICTASIISKSWAITAAHCTPTPAHFSFLTAGVVDTDEKGPYNKLRLVKRIIRHPKYEQYTIDNSTRANYDISLLQVAVPFVWNEFVKPVKLAGRFQVFEPGECVAIGFGLTEKVYAENEACASGDSTSVPKYGIEMTSKRGISAQALLFRSLMVPVFLLVTAVLVFIDAIFVRALRNENKRIEISNYDRNQAGTSSGDPVEMQGLKTESKASRRSKSH